jgi:hypothetical protein
MSEPFDIDWLTEAELSYQARDYVAAVAAVLIHWARTTEKPQKNL